MGNCLRHDSKVHWAGEDWTPALMTDVEKSEIKKEEERHKKDEPKIREVKVKITKKQLEELLGNMSNIQEQGLSPEQVIGKLVKVSVHYETHIHKSWKPRLQSIPEV
ncbi:Leucine aminopeptidase [Bienertia sinuspersici]